MKNWRKLTAALLGLCIAAGSALPVTAADRDPFDLNGDNVFDLLDIVSMIKYVHNYKNGIFYVQSADLNNDRTVDIYDLALLKYAYFYGRIPDSADTWERDVLSLSEKFRAQEVEELKTEDIDENLILGQTQFSLGLLQETVKKEEMQGKNVLISPYSVSQALGMCANGAAGDTLSEMESVLGAPMDSLNQAFYTFRTNASHSQRATLQTANSIWVRNGYSVKDEFLQTNADYYGADAYRAPFDNTTVQAINDWVYDKTDKMIPGIVDKLEDDDMMVLVNAVTFDAEWLFPYTEYQITDNPFYAADGSEQDAKLMNMETWSYISDDHAIGFTNRYVGNYYFAALLPEEGMTVENYISGLTAEGLHKTLTTPTTWMPGVFTALPEFEYDFKDTLNDQLKDMGMPSAFNISSSDFTGMSDDPRGLYIGQVIHKTHIEMTPQGTRASAATAIDMVAGACAGEDEPIYITLNRPFVYMIVNSETNLPIFIGTVNSID